MSDCLFYVFARLAVAAALFMVSSRGAVNGAVGMIAALVAVAADFFLLDAPFLGVLQILVYAGAVMVLFLFIIMLLDVDKASRARRPASKWALGIAVTLILTGAIVWGVTHAGLPGDALPAHPVVARHRGRLDRRSRSRTRNRRRRSVSASSRNTCCRCRSPDSSCSRR